MEEKSFLDKLPNWLRWALFMPASFVGCLLSGIIFTLSAKREFSSGSNNILLEYARSWTIAIAFVAIAGYIAPKNKLAVSGIMATVVIMVATTNFVLNQLTHEIPTWSAVLHTFFAIFGALVAVYAMYYESQQKSSKRKTYADMECN